MGWQDDFKLRDNLQQEDIYPFETKLHELGGAAVGPIANATHLLKSAIFAGWIETPEAQVGTVGKDARFELDGVSIAKMEPGKVLWYGGQVGKLYALSLAIPPN